MYHGKNKTEWQHTSAMLACIANIMCDSKSKALTPDDFNPYTKKENKQKTRDIPKADISLLKKVFIDKKVDI